MERIPRSDAVQRPQRVKKIGLSEGSMKIEISKEDRTQAIASIRQYFQENVDGQIGELAAGLLLNFFVEDIGPLIYNRAIADAQQRMGLRVADLNGELYCPEFQYWVSKEKKGKR